MTLEELGARLREKRVEKGYSIEDIAARLKVPPRVLKAIEEGNREALPHTVYIRSFVKSGGALLGIGAEELAGMLAALDDGSEVPHPIKPKGMMDSQMEGEKRHGAGLLLKLLLLALIGVGGYVYYTTNYREEMPSVLRFGTDRSARVDEASEVAETESQVQTEDISRESVSSIVDPSMENPWGEPASPPVSGAAAVSQVAPTGEIPPEPAPLQDAVSGAESELGAENPEMTENQEQAETASTESVETATQGEAAETLSADIPSSSERWTLRSPAGSRHKLVITAREDCWLSASADSDAARKGGTLHGGETFTAEFNDRLTLRLGNAGGVDVFYDGEKQTALGKRGGVMTVTFPPR